MCFNSLKGHIYCIDFCSIVKGIFPKSPKWLFTCIDMQTSSFFPGHCVNSPMYLSLGSVIYSYTYTYIHTHTHIHTHMYTYMYT